MEVTVGTPPELPLLDLGLVGRHYICSIGSVLFILSTGLPSRPSSSSVAISTKLAGFQSRGVGKENGPLVTTWTITASSSISYKFGSSFGVIRKDCPQWWVSLSLRGDFAEFRTIRRKTNRSLRALVDLAYETEGADHEILYRHEIHNCADQTKPSPPDCLRADSTSNFEFPRNLTAHGVLQSTLPSLPNLFNFSDLSPLCVCHHGKFFLCLCQAVRTDE